MEELPTIEKLKIRHPNLCRNWNCCVCNKEKETYDHIWLCENQKEMMEKIIEETQNHFNKEISNIKSNNDNNSKSNKVNNLQSKEFKNMWLLEKKKDKITFIDLIKGIIPQNLKDIITNITKRDRKTNNKISNIMNNKEKKIH